MNSTAEDVGQQVAKALLDDPEMLKTLVEHLALEAGGFREGLIGVSVSAHQKQIGQIHEQLQELMRLAMADRIEPTAYVDQKLKIRDETLVRRFKDIHSRLDNLEGATDAVKTG